MFVYIELLFISVKNNYYICIIVGLDDNFFFKIVFVVEKVLIDMKCGMLLFF